MKKLFFTIAFAIGLVGLLAGCDNTAKLEAARLVDYSAGVKFGAKDEAGKAESRWLTARETIRGVGKTTPREGNYTSVANCKVLPAKLVASSAYQEFKILGLETFKDACAREVGVIVAERKANNNRAIAQAKQREAKQAIAKLKPREDGIEKIIAAKKTKDDKLDVAKAKAKQPKPPAS